MNTDNRITIEAFRRVLESGYKFNSKGKRKSRVVGTDARLVGEDVDINIKLEDPDTGLPFGYTFRFPESAFAQEW